jgi:hypothetical protein
MKDYTKSESRAKDLEAILHGDLGDHDHARNAERFGGLVIIEREPDGVARVCFPGASSEDKSRRSDAFRLIQEIKSIEGRRYDPIRKVWMIPAESFPQVEGFAAGYGVEIVATTAGYPADAATRISELERHLATLTAERDAAVALSDQYAAMLDSQAVAA